MPTPTATSASPAKAQRRPAQAAPRITLADVRRLGRRFAIVTGIAVLLTLARFSEAFLVLRAGEAGVPPALVPMVVVAMNAVYSLTAYPFGKLADRVTRARLLALGVAVLLAADLLLAAVTVGAGWGLLLAGVALWGVHLGITQGLLAAMVADSAPADLRGTAFGLFNLVSSLVMLASSAMAGLLWERLGASYTFGAGALFCVVALLILARSPFPRPDR